MPYDQTYTVTVEADGTAVVSWNTGGAINWNMTQVSVEMASAPSGSACVLRKGGALITPLVATGDAAAGEPSIFLRPGEVMSVVWSGCTPGDQGRVFIIYDRIGFE